MARGLRGLQREVTRHSLATVIAGAVAAVVILIAALVTGDPPTVDSAGAAGLTLAFGAYGPVFLWLSQLAFRGLDGDRLRARLRRSEERSSLVRFLYVGGPKTWAMLIVMIGIVAVVLLATRGEAVELWLIATCVAGVAGTWVTLVAVFAVEHMRTWAEHDGMVFPGDGDRDFSDFLYVSIQLSTAFSSADVALTNRHARGLANVHAIVGFTYSAVIIAVFASLLITLAV